MRALALGFSAFAVSISLGQASLQGVGLPPGATSSWVAALSGDGRSAVVSAQGGAGTTWTRWQRGAGYQFPSLELDYVNRGAMSYDGGILAASRRRSAPAGGTEGVRYAPGGAQVVTQRVGYDGGGAYGVSWDGAVVVGGLDRPNLSSHPFRWTATTGAVVLPNTTGEWNTSAAGVSGDGRVVFGTAYTPGLNQGQGVRWVDGVCEALGVMDGYAGPGAASYDGSVLVGEGGWYSGANKAVRWTQAVGWEYLADPLGRYGNSRAYAVSADGQTIVGAATLLDGSAGEVFVWTAGTGMRPLSAVLAELGVDASGWRLDVATSISADGLTIAGYGLNIGAVRGEGWVATIPEPAAPLLWVVAAGAGLCGRARRRFTLAVGRQ